MITGPDGPGVVITDEQHAEALCERLKLWLDERPEDVAE